LSSSDPTVPTVTVSFLGKDLELSGSLTNFNIASAKVVMAFLLNDVDILRPKVGIAMGLCHIWTQGSSDITTNVRTDRTTLSYGEIFGELDLRISRQVSIPIGAAIGAFPSKVVVKIDNRKVATFFSPLIEIALGLRIHFPRASR
jgi:hypothetical protein